MKQVSTKVASSGLAGATTGVLIWVISQFGLYIPGEIGAYIVTIVSFIIGWLVTEKRLPAIQQTIAQAEETPTRPAVDLPTIPQP